ncbi:FHA domain-containing protein [Prosthecobacter sp.]|uniref:FHA domain-containing protein n=1 Tax=Prosthecobacter sp. TaxID=1965333 RepID=UPI003784C117
MKNPHTSAAATPSDQEIETMLSKTSARLFSSPTESSGFLHRMLVVRKITSFLPMEKGAICLVALQDGGLGAAGFKTVEKTLVVGRSPDAGWQVEDRQHKLSARHFSITRSGRDVLLMDNNSTNGTRVNENPEKIKQPHPLHHGDFIHAGGCSFLIAIDEP